MINTAFIWLQGFTGDSFFLLIIIADQPCGRICMQLFRQIIRGLLFFKVA
jgi:hypothetical protein